MTPVGSAMVFIYYLATWKETTYDQTYVYPWWGELIGIILASTSMLTIPIYFAISYFNAPGRTFTEVIE